MTYEINLKEKGIEFIELTPEACPALPNGQLDSLEFFDLCYRSLCSVMFNHASSGHPGGSVSSGRIVQSLVFNRMDYDIGNPMDRTADILSYATSRSGRWLRWARLISPYIRSATSIDLTSGWEAKACTAS